MSGHRVHFDRCRDAGVPDPMEPGDGEFECPILPPCPWRSDGLLPDQLGQYIEHYRIAHPRTTEVRAEPVMDIRLDQFIGATVYINGRRYQRVEDI